jgi:hypothetical protein
VIVHRDVFDICRKRKIERFASQIFSAGSQARSSRLTLPTAMLARQLINTALKRFAEPEIIAVQGQNLLPRMAL